MLSAALKFRHRELAVLHDELVFLPQEYHIVEL
jgi:hypothetical protein